MSISPSYVDGLELRIKELGKQVEKLTKERDELEKAAHHYRFEAETIMAIRCEEGRQQIAALAEQNEKLRKVLPHCVVGASGYAVEQLFIECLSLPDLSTPVLNKYRAEGMRMAAEICEHISDEYREREWRRYPELKTDAESGASDCESSIRAQAHELENSNG